MGILACTLAILALQFAEVLATKCGTEPNGQDYV